MANTYTEIYIHLVFAVKNRESLITPELEPQLHKMLTTILQNNRNKLYAINGMSDHVHLFFSMSPNESLSNLVKELKTATSLWINREKLSRFHFGWQEGYGAFSYSHSHIDAVVKYILAQKEHHKKISFREEYTKMLQAYDIKYNDDYLFQWILE